MQNIFRNIVLNAADKYFYQDIYGDIINDHIHSEEAIRGLVRSKVVFLEDDPFPTYRLYLDEVGAPLKSNMEDYFREGKSVKDLKENASTRIRKTKTKV